MTTEREGDPLERLRVLNPVTADELDALVWAEPAQACFRRIVAGEFPTAQGRPGRLRAPLPAGLRRPRRALPVAVLAVVGSMSLVVAGYALVGRQPSKPQTVACFAAADLQAETAVVGTGEGGPVATCARLRDQGFLGGAPASTLRPCVLESGAVGVFPQASGRDVCLDLGLASVSAPGGGRASSSLPSIEPDDPAMAAARFTAFRDAVLPRFVGQGCVGARPAEMIVREELARAGLEGWSVVSGVGEDGLGFSAERPCASLNFKPEVRTVELAPVPLPSE
jgi:hypothetical protein